LVRIITERREREREREKREERERREREKRKSLVLYPWRPGLHVC
jgi:hypothetical protein